MQPLQGGVGALARQAHDIGQLLLRDAQDVAHAGVQHRVAQGGQAARHPHIGVVEAVRFACRDELPQPLVELVHDEAVKADGVVQQPVEGVYMQPGHHGFAQGVDVVTVGLAFEHRALAEPAARRDADQRRGLALRVVDAHFEQTVDHAEPVGHGPPGAAHGFAHFGQGNPDVRGGPFPLLGHEGLQPGNSLQLAGGG